MEYHPEKQFERELNRKRLVEMTARFIFIFGICHVLLGLLLFHIHLPLFQMYIAEDGYLEYLTAFFLLLTAFSCLYTGLTIEKKMPTAFFLLMAILFFFGFGEEISWGQRLFGFETPEKIKMANTQQEFNLHNLRIGEVGLNKLIFGKLMHAGLFLYFMGFNLLYKKTKWFRQITDITGMPLPAPAYSIFFVLSFLIMLLIQNTWKWEIGEFAIGCSVFLCFLRPYNSKLQHPMPLA